MKNNKIRLTWTTMVDSFPKMLSNDTESNHDTCNCHRAVTSLVKGRRDSMVAIISKEHTLKNKREKIRK